MRVLVTGAAGQLGGDLARALTAAGHTPIATDVHGDPSSALDITDPDGVAAALDAHGPDALVNCAAWTKVDAAEGDPDGAHRLNAVGPRVLAGACHRAGVLLLHVSTDFVFGDVPPAPVDEWTVPAPLGVYGRSKLAGEEEVRRLCPRHLMVRTAWLYGRKGPNFVLTMLRLARERGALTVVADQVGSPTWTGHLAPALVRLLERDVPGTYHLTNAGAVSWHGFAEAIVAAAGVPVPVRPITTADYPTPARRPPYSVLDNRAWRLLGESPLPAWEEGLRSYLAELGEAAAPTG